MYISNDAAICDSITLAYGVISYSPSTTPRLEGSVATHSCDKGYGLSLSVRTRTCQPNRTWSGEEITCQRKNWVYRRCYTLMYVLSAGITCSPLPKVTNGTINYSSGTTAPYNYEITATYQCNHGHMLTSGGDRVRTCTGDGSTPSGQWSGAALQCPRMLYYCIGRIT